MAFSVHDIKILGLEIIRKRPEMYFNQCGREICIHLLKEVMTSLCNPKYHSNSKNIELKISRKGGLIIRYDGQGMPINSEEYEGVSHPIVYNSIMNYPMRASEEPDYKKYGHLSYIGCYLAAMCKELTITTLDKEYAYTSSFIYGSIVGLFSRGTHDFYNSNEIYIIFDDALIESREINNNDLENISLFVTENFPDCNVKISS